MIDRTATTPFMLRIACAAAAVAVVSLLGAPKARAGAEAQILIEASTGKVLHAENAGYPWYPASITKVMTTYVTLRAMKEGRLTPDSLLTVSTTAAAEPPSKMGFKPGTQLTVDNALKMMMVKSANDMAVVLAEGVAGSIDNFSEEMNRTARRLGMTQTHYVNPNGLPADGQVSSARDLAILARAIIKEFPEYDFYWNTPAIKFGKRTTRNFNALIDRYPGADGMKTGFICASGFNLMATATRDGRQLIAVVLGAPSSPVRAAKAAQLLERGFNGPTLSWLTPALGTVDALATVDASPPNLREEMCGKNRRRPAAETDDDSESETIAGSDPGQETPLALSLTSARPATARGADLIAPAGGTPSQVVEVYLGPSRKKGQPVTQLASAGAAGGTVRLPVARPGQIAAGTEAAKRPTMAAAGAMPWTSFSATSLAESPPPALAVAATDAVPMPRRRPKAAPR